MALRKRTNKQRKALWVLGLILPLALYMAATPLVHAVSYDAEIRELERKNNQSRSQQAVLRQRALPLVAQVASLNEQIATLQGLIADNQTKRDKLAADIAQAQTELDQQRSILGQNIRKMYVESGMTTLEMLATSKDLSHYVDKEQYQVTLRDKVEASVKRIDALKAQLDEQKASIDKLLAEQQSIQSQLDGQRAEVARLLSFNQAQQAAYDQSIKKNSDEIDDLERKQTLENNRHNVGDVIKGGTGGYPYANAPWPNSISDPWGMHLRQCVSYTAWRVDRSGRTMPNWGGHGNAKLWDDNARADGIPVDSNPRPGDVAVSNSGEYGHVMYVETVHGNGTITVSQYNASWDGKYSIVTRSTDGLVFIHF